MSTIKVNRIENTSTTDGGVSIDTDGHVTIDGQQLPTAGPLSNRNLIINGAMQVAQRGTSSNSSGYHTIDRFLTAMDGGTYSQSQEDVSTSDLPYTNDGIGKFARITNTTAPPDTTGFRGIRYSFESQDLYNSGWQHQNSNSFITVSFWVRASVSQKFYASIQATNGTSQNYVWGFTPAANTWTKVTKVIPGFASITLNNDANLGAYLNIAAFWGTNFTDSGVSEDAWEAWLTGTRFPDFSTTWKNTAGATFDITGVQLEVGSKATPFEHRSYGDELLRCQRYYYRLDINNGAMFGSGLQYNATDAIILIQFPVQMRTNVGAVEQSGTASHYGLIYGTGTATCSGVPTFGGDPNKDNITVNFTVNSGAAGATGDAVIGRSRDNAAYLGFSAEL